MKKMVAGLVIWVMVLGCGMAWAQQVMLTGPNGRMKAYEVYHDMDVQMILNYNGRDLPYGYRDGDHWVLMDYRRDDQYQIQGYSGERATSERFTVLDDKGRLHTYDVSEYGDEVEIWDYEKGELLKGRWHGNSGYFLNMKDGSSYWINR